MTIPILKISVLRKPVIKGKMDARFPADVSVTSPIMLDRTGGNYLFGLSITDLRASLDVVYAPIGSNVVQSVTNDTNVTGSIASQNLTLGWTGQLAIARGGTGASTALSAFDALKQSATETSTGVVELATNAETATGSDTSRATTPADVKYGVQNGTWFTQDGTGASARTLISKLKDFPLYPEDFGAAGDGTTDDTAAIQAAINAAGARGMVLFGPKTYKFTSTLTITNNYVTLEGAGKNATKLLFVPTAADTAIDVSNGATSVWFFALKGIQLHSSDTTYTKVGLSLSDLRGAYISEFNISGDDVGIGGTESWGGGTGSTGVQIYGREFILIDKTCTISAEKPIVISRNPNSIIDLDHCEIGATLIADNNVVVAADATVFMSNDTFSGSWNGGTTGFFFSATTPSVTSYNLRFENLRTEQGQNSSNYSINIDGGASTNINQLSIVNVNLDNTRNGIRLRNVVSASIVDTIYGSTSGIGLSATSSVGNIFLANTFWNVGSTASLSGLNTIFAGPTVPSTGPLPGNAYYSTRSADFNGDVLSTGRTGVVSGQLKFLGSTSGTALFQAQAVQGTPQIDIPTTSGPIVTNGTAPVVINPVTGNASLSGTTAQFNTALSDGDFATLAGSETLTNKTLTAATLATRLVKGVYIIAASAVASATHTGTVAETTIATVTIPANSMGANGRIEVEAVWGFASGGAPGTRTVRHKFGGSGCHTQAAASTTLTYSAEIGVANRNATNSQVVRNSATAGGWGSTTSAVTTFAVDTTADVAFTFTCQLADTGDSAILHSYCVKLVVP